MGNMAGGIKDALESIPCEVFSIDHLAKCAEVKVLSRDNIHEWARENGGPITDEMIEAGADELLGYPDNLRSRHEIARAIYTAMEAKRREGK